jgi:hypothetical protein
MFGVVEATVGDLALLALSRIAAGDRACFEAAILHSSAAESLLLTCLQ